MQQRIEPINALVERGVELELGFSVMASKIKIADNENFSAETGEVLRRSRWHEVGIGP